MDSLTAKGTRNRTSFVTEENAGMGPDPGREVHISPLGFSQQATERKRTSQEQVQLQVEASSHCIQELGQPEGILWRGRGRMRKLFCNPSVVVVTRTHTRIKTQNAISKKGILLHTTKI